MSRAALLSLCFTGSHAFPSLQAKIPNADKVKDCDGNAHPGVGHLRSSGGGPRNPFGLDFDAAGKTWTTELCEKDSDGDGVANGRELGDPNCVWTEGGVPTFDRGITHPGIDCSNLDCQTGEAMLSAKRNTGPLGCAKYEHPTVANTSFLFSGHPVGPGTSYVMQAFQVPNNLPQAAVTKFQFVVEDPRVVHHMILYRCPTDQSDRYSTPAEKARMECFQVLMAWAVGGSDFCAPENLGYIVDPGEYLILETHYDNPNNIEGIVDHSGMVLHGVANAGSGLTPAQVAIIGSRLPDVSVPPLTKAHRGTVTISANQLNVPEEGVTIFAFIHHMHQIGVKQWVTTTSLEEDGAEQEVACITNYDFDLQEAIYRPEPFVLRRGQELTVDCVWDSSSRDWVTNGGDESQDEMCVFILMLTPPLPDSLITVRGTTFSDRGDKRCGCPEGNSPINDNNAPKKSTMFAFAFLAVASALRVM